MTRPPRPPKFTFGRAPLVLGAILVLMVLLWFGRPTLPTGTNASVNTQAMQAIPAEQVLTALPGLKQRPMVLEFRTNLCADCQALAPVLDKVAKAVPTVGVMVYNLDTDRKQNPALFNLFKPLTVPTLLFITPSGQVQAVFSDHPPSQDQLLTAFNELAKTNPAPKTSQP
jgi:thiol-disulfide isomerase/thioredoxin